MVVSALNGLEYVLFTYTTAKNDKTAMDTMPRKPNSLEFDLFVSVLIVVGFSTSYNKNRSKKLTCVCDATMLLCI